MVKRVGGNPPVSYTHLDVYKRQSFDRFTERSAYYFAELNYIHPFREGNGRATREFIRLLFLKNDYEVDWAAVPAEKLLDAMELSVYDTRAVSYTHLDVYKRQVITNEAVKIKGGRFAAAPRFAVLDPEYTMTLPESQVLSGAFDTLSHAMETYFGRSDRDNVSDEVAEAVMRSTITNMPVSYTHLP